MQDQNPVLFLHRDRSIILREAVGGLCAGWQNQCNQRFVAWVLHVRPCHIHVKCMSPSQTEQAGDSATASACLWITWMPKRSTGALLSFLSSFKQQVAETIQQGHLKLHKQHRNFQKAQEFPRPPSEPQLGHELECTVQWWQKEPSP